LGSAGAAPPPHAAIPRANTKSSVAAAADFVAQIDHFRAAKAAISAKNRPQNVSTMKEFVRGELGIRGRKTCAADGAVVVTFSAKDPGALGPTVTLDGLIEHPPSADASVVAEHASATLPLNPENEFTSN